MKNLKCLGLRAFSLPPSSAAVACIDQLNDQLLVLSKEANGLPLQLFKFPKDNTKISSTDLGFEHSGSPLSIHALLEDNSIVITTSDGHILKVEEDSDSAVPIGQIDCGIVAVAWSPDEQVFLVASPEKILAFSPSFDVLWEQAVRNVTEISWRPDGGFFCVNHENSESKRQISTFDLRFNQISTSEAIEGLSHAAAWKSSGELIVSSAKVSHKQEVVFFEKNGLRHGEFDIPKDAWLKGLSWNCDGQLLALHIITDSKADNKSIECIRIMHRSNYHWSIKYEIKDCPINFMFFDSENPLKFYYATLGKIFEMDFEWHVFIAHRNGSTTVIVVDGNQLKFTPFAYSNVPPPMAHFILTLDHSVIALAQRGNRMVALDSMNNVTLIEYESVLSLKDWIEPKIISTRCLRDIHHCYGIMLCENDDILAIGFNSDENEYCIELRSEHSSQSQFTQSIHLIGFVECNESSMKLVQDYSGKLHQISINDHNSFTIQQWQHSPTILVKRPWIELVIDNNNNFVVFSLTSNHHFYVDDHLLVSDCNSFYILPEFVILSTTDHKLLFFPLSTSTRTWKTLVENPSEESLRRTERGTKIICACPWTSALILQMPRGNLETIYPRALVISQIRHQLSKQEYEAAFEQARRHRVDLNLLVDFDPLAFQDNIRKFIQDVRKIDYLNQFITALRNEDVTTSLFKGFVSQDANATSVNDYARKDKVNRLCKAFIQNFEALDARRYIETIITAFVRQSPSQIESALQRVSAIADVDLFDSTLKYIIFLVDPLVLYKAALSMYNFKMALSVAQNAQMDPKEYGPFLKELQAMEKDYALFKINDYIERPKVAVRHIARTTHFNEALAYIKKHELYKEALDAYNPSMDAYKAVMLSHADVLVEKQEFERAALCYKIGGQLDRAMTLYLQAGKWQEAFFLAKLLDVPGEKILAMATSVKDRLVDRRRYLEAGVIALDYLHDLEMAIDILIAGNEWFEALRIATVNDRLDLSIGKIEPALSKSYFQMLNEISEQIVLFDKHLQRLLVVRAEKQEKKRLEEEMIETGDLENIEIQSETEMSFFTTKSKTSMGSRSSTRSKRKAQKPRLRAKEGGRYEEEYLMSELSTLITKFAAFKNEVKALSKALAWFSKFDLLDTLDKAYTAALTQVCNVDTITDIFTTTTIHDDIPTIERPILSSDASAESHKLFFKEI